MALLARFFAWRYDAIGTPCVAMKLDENRPLSTYGNDL